MFVNMLVETHIEKHRKQLISSYKSFCCLVGGNGTHYAIM